MSLHPTLKILLWLYRWQGTPEMHELSPEEARKAQKTTLRRAKFLFNYRSEALREIHNLHIDSEGHQIPLRVYIPFGKEPLPLLMFFHGGGFVISDLDTHDSLCRRLAAQAGCIVASVDYRLAPEYKYPAAVLDCYHATRWMHAHAYRFGGDAERIAVAGDSAGGNLAAVVCLMARENNFGAINAQVLIYPVVDARLQDPEISRLGKGYLLTEKLMRWFMNHYKASDEQISEIYMSPILADLKGLPPALIITAGFDPLRGDGISYARQLREAGVPVHFKEYPDMIHAFMQMPKLLKACRQAETLIAHFLKNNFIKVF